MGKNENGQNDKGIKGKEEEEHGNGVIWCEHYLGA